MDIRATFLPVGEDLIDNVFPTSITYIRNLGSSYDPSTGEVTQNTEEFSIKAGVLSRGRSEEGGVGETYELRLDEIGSPVQVTVIEKSSGRIASPRSTPRRYLKPKSRHR